MAAPTISSLGVEQVAAGSLQFTAVIAPNGEATLTTFGWSTVEGGPYTDVPLPAGPFGPSAVTQFAVVNGLLAGQIIWYVWGAENVDGPAATEETSITVSESFLESPVGLCGWSPNRGCCNINDDVIIEDETRAMADAVATEVLWALSGRQYGVCETVVRPCRDRCLPNWWESIGSEGWYWRRGGGRYGPILDSGIPFVSCRCGGDSCGCSTECVMKLPSNVTEIVQIIIDGFILDPADYRLEQGQGEMLLRRVVLPRNGACWPTCQDFNLPTTSPDTWSIRYKRGRPVPAGGQYAAGVLVCEILKSCLGKTCQLPKRVQSVMRQGVSITFLDPQDFLDKGLTGVYEVDLWLRSVNPGRLTRRPQVVRVDDPKRGRLRRQ